MGKMGKMKKLPMTAAPGKASPLAKYESWWAMRGEEGKIR